MLCLELGNERSSLSEIDGGVPQGSALTPLLFLIYIVDIYHSLSSSITIHFADDIILVSGQKPPAKNHRTKTHQSKNLLGLLPRAI